MADVKISALPAVTSITSTDILPVVTGGVTKSVPAYAIASQLGSAVPGVVVGTGQSGAVQIANATALSAAVTAAQSSLTRTLDLPAGTIEMDITTAFFTFTAGVKIRGRGMDVTKIKVFPSTGPPSWTANLFHITGSAIKVEVEDCEVQGPAVASSSSAARAFYMSTATTNTSLYLRRVRISGLWTIGINVDNAAGRTVQTEDCDITASEQGWSYNADPGGVNAAGTAVLTTNTVTSVTMTNNGSGYGIAPIIQFVGGGGTGATGHANMSGGTVNTITIDTVGSGYTSPPTVNFLTGYPNNVARSVRTYVHDVGTTNLMHLHYFHPNVAVNFETCRFGNSSGYALQFNGSPTLPAPYQRFLDCTNDGVNNGFLVGTNGQPVDFIGGYYANNPTTSAFNVNGPINVTSATVRNIQLFNRQNNTAFDCTFTDLDYDGGIFGVGLGTFDGAGNAYIFNSCRFAGNVTSQTYANNNLTDTTVIFKNCTFHGNANYWIRADTGTTIIRGCDFLGTVNNFCIYGTPGAAATYRLTVTDCDFTKLTAGECIRLDSSNSASYNSLRGGGNQWRSDSYGVYSNTASSYHGMTPRAGLNPVAITSAAALVLSANYSVHKITGSTVPTSINFVDTSGNYTRCMGGEVVLIFDNALTITAGGSSPSAIKNTITTVANQPVVAVLDGSAGGWWLR